MNYTKRFLAVFCIFIIAFASSVSAFAIGFDGETVYKSIFVVYSNDSIGSGFSIGENCVITNAHVISDNKNLKIATYEGKEYPAYIVAIDKKADIALLGIDSVNFVPLDLADLNEVKVGEDVYAIGAPNSLAYTLTKGVLSSKDRVVNGENYLQTDAAINTGNSGGPLLNDYGKVLGINSYKISNSEGIGLAIPVSKILEFLKENKIVLNNSGNVTERVSQGDVDSSKSNEKNYDNQSKNIQKTSNVCIYVLVIVLILSLILNIVLIIILYRKKKNVYIPIDPSERTDFDIDILE